MKKQILFTVIIALTLYGCAKEELIVPLKTTQNTTNNGATSKDGLNRALSVVYEGDKIADVWCPRIPGNCFEDVVVTSKTAYEGLVSAVTNDTQLSFFNSNNYWDVFGVEEDFQIQDALEKGHIKIRIERTATTDFNLFLKSQHMESNPSKLEKNVIFAIPVVMR